MNDAAAHPTLVDARQCRYALFAPLDRGGMGTVSLATALDATGTSRIVVVKQLRSDDAASDALSDMFLAEAQLAARMEHPNVVRTFDAYTQDGQLFVVMEYLDGASLHALGRALEQRGQRMDPRVAARIVSEALAGLHYAHELRDYDGTPLQVVHRDVSPHNLFLTWDGRVKLLDFGVARAASQARESKKGMLKGKVGYIAPESAEGLPIDRRADVFSAGVVLWELLTGHTLFDGPHAVSNLARLLYEPYPRVSSLVPDVDPALDAIVACALQRDRDVRFATAGAMRGALEAWLARGGRAPSLPDVAAPLLEPFAAERAKRMEMIRYVLLSRGAQSSSGSLAMAGSLGPVGSLPPASRRSLPDRRFAWVIAGAAACVCAAVVSVAALRRRPPAASVAHAAVVPAAVVPVAHAPAAIESPDSMQAPSAGGTFDYGVAPSGSDSVPTAVTGDAPTAIADASPSVGAAPSHGSPSRRNAPARATRTRTAPAPRRPVPATVVAAAPSPKDAGGFLTLDTYPWTRVSHNGRVIGTTPLVRAALPAGKQTIVLENAEQGVRQTLVVTIAKGETTAKRVAFK